ncbi:PspC domain-containing protein [Streptosporangium sp. NBC_01755]|uniref:PspC domain-containing protein n=1 Tax=unclassified Streptosporangium TaxID=2632669 RepID=UPI002DD8FAA0|nr:MULTISPECIES: PspC domain-containing protein [unclassified Streptosporangium]WSA24323.1 PspC domain-containing protein [Streptosporangium sp. NBC_01810]WSC97603.1 PspC domain-containing protein [Streptosporangium sp. NBC_01755]
MNDTDPASATPGSPPGSPAEDRCLRRSDEGRMLTGVCAGLGRYAGIDPVLLRVGFAVLVLGSGIGIMLYIAAFLLMRETNGGPGYVEQWSRRDFDSETVLTLLTGLFALGLVVNVSSDGVGTATVVVGTVFAIALLAAHSRGVDLLAVARSLPDRLRRRRAPRPADQWPGPFAHGPGTAAVRRPVGEQDPASRTTAPPASGLGAYATRPGGETVTERYAPAAEAGPWSAPERPSPAPAPAPEARAGSAPGTPPGPGSEAGPQSSPQAGPESASETFAGAVPDSPARPAPPPGDIPPDPYRTARPSFDSSGEPFSPYGPYRPLDPRRRQQPYSPYTPYAPSGHGATAMRPPRPRRPRSLVGVVTIFLAMIVGGITVAIQSASGQVNMTVAGGAALVVVGVGLLVAAWFGRGAGLVATGTVLSIALVAGPMLGGVPKRYGNYHWEPTSLSEMARSYSVGVGEGVLDLSELVLPPGSRTVVDISVSVGEISVILPATARIEVKGRTRFGDVKIDHTVEGGADIRHDKILEPEVAPKGDVATIVLNVKAGIGDVEVRRAA